MGTLAAILAGLVVWLGGANLMHGFLVGMIERGARTMQREGYDPGYTETCRRMGYDRLAASSLLWPITLIELALLLFTREDRA